MDAIRYTDAPLLFPPVPAGHADHIRYSFAMAVKGKGEAYQNFTPSETP